MYNIWAMGNKNEIKNQTFDEERSLYNLKYAKVLDCTFSGPKDGESPLKESRNIEVRNCNFDLRYSFWHVVNGDVRNCKFSNTARAPFWYCRGIGMKKVESEAVKVFRECNEITIDDSSFVSEEPFWRCNHLVIRNTKVAGFYSFFQTKDLEITNLNLTGKYSFQYNVHLRINKSCLDTKDAFWHCRDVVVRDSVIKGEYIGWYSSFMTFINCTIESHQPFCYADNIRLINCKMPNCDLAFEKSSVTGNIIGEIESIKNPKRCNLKVGKVKEVIKDGAINKVEINIEEGE
ncbi:MAG: DUF3737 family protein [Bacilli bacterium]|nr:DUF3737 family protein [Bacilli bacterium]